MNRLANGASDVPWVSIIIVTYNSGRLLQKCIDALARQTMSEFEAIVVDNASDDNSVMELHLPDRRFCIIPANRNLGFAAGCNLGLRTSHAAWIATLNPDATPTPSWLAALRRATVHYSNMDMFGSTQVDAANPDRLDGCGDVYSFLGVGWRGQYGHPIETVPPEGEVFSPCAASALYRRNALEKVGGFDETFFCYCEDIDLGFRIRLAGGRCIQVPDAIVYHVGSAISGKGSAFAVFHTVRNRVWVIVKNCPLPLLVALLPLHLIYMGYSLWRNRRRETFPAMVAGLWAAFRGIGLVLRARRKIQRRRVVSTGDVAGMLCWKLGKLRKLNSDVRVGPSMKAPDLTRE